MCPELIAYVLYRKEAFKLSHVVLQLDNMQKKLKIVLRSMQNYTSPDISIVSVQQNCNSISIIYHIAVSAHHSVPWKEILILEIHIYCGLKVRIYYVSLSTQKSESVICVCVYSIVWAHVFLLFYDAIRKIDFTVICDITCSRCLEWC